MKVSVIIPCFNAAPFVEAAIDSVFSQTYKNLEIILVDNNSEDETLEVLRQYQEKKTGLISVLKENRRGVCFARNAGLRLASGEWIQFLDADDVLLPGKIQQQVNLIKNDIPFIAGTPIYVDKNGQRKARPPEPDFFKGLFEGLGLGNTCANLWNHSILKQVGGWNEELPDTEDPELMFRLLKWNEHILRDLIPGVIIRDNNPCSLSKTNPAGMYFRHILLRKKMVDYLKKEKPMYFQKNQNYYWNMFYRYVRMLTNYDFDKGVECFYRYLPPGFLPVFVEGKKGQPLWNIILVWLIGFRNTEKIKWGLKKSKIWPMLEWVKKSFLKRHE